MSISYLQGKNMGIVNSLNNRIFIILEVNNIGYEVQITPRFSRQLQSDNNEEIKIFTHLQIQEDRQVLYGFSIAIERDLFRQLVSVSGIGMQLALALIDTLGITDLIEAIVTNNILVLTKTPGVGKKTAERISLELKTKLAKWQKITDVKMSPSAKDTNPRSEIMEDLEMTLLALGYSDEEITSAISAISSDRQLLKNPNVEEWIRSAISWLTGE